MTLTASRNIMISAALLAAGLALIITLAVAILSFDRNQTGRHNPKTENAYVGGEVTPLCARVPGYLVRLPITDNQIVHAGDRIARIEDDDYRTSVDQAMAQLAAAQARLAAIDAMLRQTAEQVEQARTSEVAALAESGRAVPELLRQKLLLHTDVGQQRNLDAAAADQRRFDAAIRAARADVTLQERRVAALRAQRAQAEAQILARQADLRLATIMLGWTDVVAPVDGTLGPRLVREGALVGGGTRLVVLTPLDSVWVDANFTERQLPDIRIGQAARLELDAFPHEPLRGHVIGLLPTTASALSNIPTDNTTGNFTKVVQRVPVRIAIDWANDGLRGRVRPGMSVTATVFTDTGG